VQEEEEGWPGSGKGNVWKTNKPGSHVKHLINLVFIPRSNERAAGLKEKKKTNDLGMG